jgi:SAM-dependent methyltransferase
MAQQSSERVQQWSAHSGSEEAGSKLGANPGNLDVILPLMRCPLDGEALSWDRAAGVLRDHNHVYRIEDGIPFLFATHAAADAPKNDVTSIVKSFYEVTPFPNYDGFDTRDSLRQKARASIAAQLLDDQIPNTATILEVGCGTGQMTNFLAMAWGRTVIGSDICHNSLKLAVGFRDRFAVNNAHFVEMNLFDPFFRKASFDVVISNGVLHHTGDAAAAFRSIQSLVKPGGHIIIGLYNWLGRLPTLWLRTLVRRFGDAAALLDSRMRRETDLGRRKAWFMDQYRHPHETKHSIDEVMNWFDSAGFDFVSCIPTIGDSEFRADAKLFEPQPKGNYLDRLSTELEMLLSGGVDGGLYIMIGRKRSQAT